VPNKAQFIELLAERLDGDRKRAAAALDAVIDSVYATVARGEKVAITGFGVFERRDRAARTARNPATGATVNVAASRVPAFRPGAEFKAIASGAKEFVERRSNDAQAAASRAATAVREAPSRAAAAVQDAVQDAVEAVREAPAKAAAAVKKQGGRRKSGGSGGSSSGGSSSGSSSSGSSSSGGAAKKAAKKTPAKKAAKKSS
jgi:DNA-binding protein HU-beta